MAHHHVEMAMPSHDASDDHSFAQPGDVNARTLLLLRHAKSSWDSADLNDHERPLNKRGAKAAPVMGAYMASKGYKPSLILCSEAVRTRATCALVLPELGTPPPELKLHDALYLAPPITLFDHIRRIDDTHTTVMIVAHNPGLHALALSLTSSGERQLIREMSMKFPTAALAVLTFKTPHWRQIATAQGYLADFQVPRDLG